MRYTLPVLAILLISLALACGDETSSNRDAQATIDAAIARINVTLAAEADEMAPTPTATPTATPVADTPAPSPTAVPTLPPTPEPEPQRSPTATAGPPPDALTRVRNWDYALQNVPESVARIAALPWITDGLEEGNEFNAAERLVNIAIDAPDALDVLLNADSISERLSPFAVIRSGSAPADSPVITVAQLAVPFLEEMFDAPFPTPAIVIHVTQYVAGTAAGTNHQTHVTLKPELDTNEEPDFGYHAIFHEIAHYYLYARPTWYAEGGADFAASYARHITAGAPIGATNSPCAVTTSLRDLELLLPADAGDVGAGVNPDLWQCNYSLGERLMLALYNQLGVERFLQGWRELYHTVARQPSYPSEHDFQNEVELRVAWLRAGGRLMQPELEHIWDQWYRGTASPNVAAVPDSTPPNPDLPSVSGRIDRAYLTLTLAGSPTDSFSDRDVSGWVYLALEYSHGVGGNPRELTLEVVEYFQDGLAYSRRNVTIDFEPRYSGGTQWISLGPSPPNRWAPGRYWAYMYESGRKVAEVEFEVTP